jgi:hypothetical protein
MLGIRESVSLTQALSHIKSPLAGGCPAASDFLLFGQEKSHQREGRPTSLAYGYPQPTASLRAMRKLASLQFRGKRSSNIRIAVNRLEPAVRGNSEGGGNNLDPDPMVAQSQRRSSVAPKRRKRLWRRREQFSRGLLAHNLPSMPSAISFNSPVLSVVIRNMQSPCSKSWLSRSVCRNNSQFCSLCVSHVLSELKKGVC